MLAGRLAAIIGVVLALLTSQLPEYIQQYRQRLGGAIDELQAIVAKFEAEAAKQSLDAHGAIARLEGNGDVLAQQQGADMDDDISRLVRLQSQARAFADAGPVSQYAVLVEDLDPGVATRAFAAYRPAVPVTVSGLLAALSGLVVGWCLTHGIALPVRHLWRRHVRRRDAAPTPGPQQA